MSGFLAPSEIALILLAAGRSERFGSDDKLLAPLGALPLAARSARAVGALESGWRFAVCASANSATATMLAAEGFEIVINPDPRRGLSSSLACGVECAGETTAKAALVCLADMPFVTVEHLQALLARFDQQEHPIVASSAGGTTMPPALFARSEFGRLRALTGDFGAKALLTRATIVDADPALLIDIDRPTDIKKTQ